MAATDANANINSINLFVFVKEPGSVYIDNLDADFVCGDWVYVSVRLESYGGDHEYHTAGTGSCTATWTPDILADGNYEVYAWWREHVNWATDAPYTIHYDGGTQTIDMNQEINGSQWNLLGTYYFVAGTSGYVVLSDDANDHVVADAIKFEPVP
jgi:hypothetical protein